MLQSSTFQVFQIKRDGFQHKIKHYWKNETAKKPSSISDSNSANSPLFDPPSLIGCNLKNRLRGKYQIRLNFNATFGWDIYLPSKQSKLLRKVEEKMQSWWSSHCEQHFFHGAGNRWIWESKDEKPNWLSKLMTRHRVNYFVLYIIFIKNKRCKNLFLKMII